MDLDKTVDEILVELRAEHILIDKQSVYDRIKQKGHKVGRGNITHEKVRSVLKNKNVCSFIDIIKKN